MWNRRAVIGSCKPGDVTSDKLIFEDTTQEVKHGWLRGPYSESEITALLRTDSWFCIKRFALQQKDKTRIIDDCKAPSLNCALTTTEKLDLMSIDSFVNLCGAYTSALKLDDSAWKNLPEEELKFVGRTLDLKAAYKQLPCHPSSSWSSVLVVWDPNRNTHSFFVSDALMFGSAASVYAFNRCARAIWHIVVCWARITVTQFYDDYPSLEIKAISSSSYAVFTAVLKSLGWTVSTSKDKPFDSTFSTLGVQMDLSGMGDLKLVVANTESRVKELLETIDQRINDQSITSSEAASLFGRVGFAMSSCFGRASAPGLRFLSKASQATGRSRFSEEDLMSMRLLHCFISHIRPRTIDFTDDRPPILVFTDASYENQHAEYGVFCIEDNNKWVAGSQIPSVLVDHWKSSGSLQIIAQAEIYPIVLLRRHVSKSWIHRKVVYYIDNDAARFGLIKAESNNKFSNVLIHSFFECELVCPTCPWFARVPSDSNVADLPSRGKLFECSEQYNAQIRFLHDTEHEFLVHLGLDS